jgi:RNA polymerase sigma factor (sigma-70 family)
VTAIELRPGGFQRSEVLFGAYRDRLVGYCLRRLGSRSEAEDAVQTTFLYAHRALQRGVVPDSEEAWLFTIAKNVCRWQQRTASRRAPLADTDTDTLGDEQDSEAREALRHDLDDALASIPERQRQAILLREWRGLSCPEIAAALELSEPATHALLSRARRALASALAAAGRRPVLGLDFGAMFLHLRSLLAGSGAKAAATAVVVAGVGVGGVAIERAVVPHGSADVPSVETRATSSQPAPVMRIPWGAEGVSLTPTMAARAPAARPRRTAVLGAGAPPRSDELRATAAPRPTAADAEQATSKADAPRAAASPEPVPVKSEPGPRTTEPEPAPTDELLPLDLPPVEDAVPLPEDVPPLPVPELPPVPDIPDPGTVVPPLPVPPDPLPDPLP